jgi:hypothetical protein
MLKHDDLSTVRTELGMELSAPSSSTEGLA